MSATADDAERPWERIYAWVQSEVAYAARRYGLSRHDQEELRQDVCVRVLSSLARFEPGGAATLETWVRRQVGWGVADYWRERLRRTRREPAVADAIDALEAAESDCPERRVHLEELSAALRDCLERLSATQRERFVAAERAFGRQERLAAVAARFGISRDGFKQALARVRSVMRRCLRAAGFEPSAEISRPQA